MNTVQRTNAAVRMIRRVLFMMPEKKYFVAGDRACGEMMRNARSRKPFPADELIFAQAVSDLRREIMEGFWERKTVNMAEWRVVPYFPGAGYPRVISPDYDRNVSASVA